jgi:hypothetical protein
MLEMSVIKPKIFSEIESVGYKLVQQQCYQKWTKGRADCVWISKQIVRATKNVDGAKIVLKIAGSPNGSVSEAQKGKYDCWYTDGYKGRGTAAIYE